MSLEQAKLLLTVMAVGLCLLWAMHGWHRAIHVAGWTAPVVQSAASHRVEPARGHGRWGLLVRPLSGALNWVHGHVVANWGWAIVLLTVMVNLLLLPFRVMGARTSVKMQRIQPEIAQIKERYRGIGMGDPRQEEMKREIAAMQKTEGVRMYGGCLSALISWPLLYGFYRMISSVPALHHAPWLLVPDLSAGDPTHLLPVIFLLSVGLSQWLTVSPGMDRRQQRLMAVTMPLIVGFATWHCAAALALYWCCGNLLNVAQQVVMSRAIGHMGVVG